MELIIKNKSQSFEQIVIDLNIYLRSLPDWESWQDYFKTGSGQTIIELIAGLGAQLFYFINIQRQETYLQTAMNRSSVIGISQMLGYSAGRGNAVKAAITVKPDSVGVFNKFTIVGSCKDKDVIMAESVLLNEGENKGLNIIIGTLKRDHIKVNSSALQPFRMTKPNISEDFILYKTSNTYTEEELQALDDDVEADKTGWIELPTSDKFIDLANDKYVVQTNVLSSVDIFYLNEGSGIHAYPYRQDDTIIIDYVELSDTEFDKADIDFFYGTVESVDAVSSYNAVENISSIKVNAPLANEVQALIRARNDAQKIVQQYGKNYISAVNSRDISSEVIEVTYIKNDYSLLSNLEYNDLHNYLYTNVRPFGVEMPFISPPVRALLELEVEVKLSNPLVRNSVTDAIASMIESLENKFIIDAQGDLTSLDVEAIEEDIENLYGVKIARIYIKDCPYTTNDYYRIGQFVRNGEDIEHIYKLERVIKYSGNSEPTWPRHEGETVVDGNIQWVAVQQIAGFGKAWEANTSYQVSDIVLPSIENGLMYEFDSYVGTSAGVEPSAEEGKSVAYDGELVWYKISKNAAAKPWQPYTSFAIGDIVSLEADSDSSYQLIDLRSRSDIEDIDWPTDSNTEIQVGSMIWRCYNCRDARNDYKSPLLDYDWNQYLHVEYDLTITE